MTGPNARAKGQGTIVRRADGRYAGALYVKTPDGGTTRKWVYGPTEPAVRKKLTELRRKRDNNHGVLPTGAITVAAWLDKWFANEVDGELRPKTAASYRTTMDRYIKPAIGKVKLETLTPEHVRKVSALVTSKGLSSRTNALAYQVLSLALKSAFREGEVTHIVTERVLRPRTKKPQLAILSKDDAKQVIKTTHDDRLGSRIAAAFLTGARQGELLGLEWSRVDFENDSIDLSWQLQRFSWEHGCTTPCGKKRGTDCPKRTVTFPPDFEHRHITGGMWWTRPKSEAGTRVVDMGPEMRAVLVRRYDAAHKEPNPEPNPHGLVWTQPNGAPMSPEADSQYWHDALVRAGLEEEGERKIRLHDARHTSATLLSAGKVAIESIQDILGHSTAAMSREYINKDRTVTRAAMLALEAGLFDAE